MGTVSNRGVVFLRVVCQVDTVCVLYWSFYFMVNARRWDVRPFAPWLRGVLSPRRPI